jgi:hypothetical protein
MSVPPPRSSLASDMARWREAWRLRRQNPRWVVFWDADIGQYGAYPLSRARRSTILTAATPGDLASEIGHAEQARE